MNWGNRLLLVFIVFAGGMAFLVYRCLHTDYQLVETDYYSTELRYQQVIDGSKRASQLSTPVQLVQVPEGIQVKLPAEMKNKKLDGSIWFYCPYDQANDKKLSLNTDRDGVQFIPAASIKPGNYSVKISWNNNGTGYYSEQNLKVI
jgi:hypothetical protein